MGDVMTELVDDVLAGHAPSCRLRSSVLWSTWDDPTIVARLRCLTSHRTPGEDGSPVDAPGELDRPP